MDTNKKVIWITRTALFLAVALIAQLIGMNMGGALFGQLLTGSLVNMALIIAGIVVGKSSGCTIALLSPLLAFLFGMMKFAPAIPVVMVGNIAIVVITSLAYNYLLSKTGAPLMQKVFIFAGMVVGACAKCAVMWLSALFILPIFVTVPPAIVASFALPQVITGTMGGLIAIFIIPSLLKVKRTI